MPRFIDQIKNIEIITPPDIKNVKPQAQIKNLGYLFNGCGNIDNQIYALCSVVGGLFHIEHKRQDNNDAVCEERFCVCTHPITCKLYFTFMCQTHPQK